MHIIHLTNKITIYLPNSPVVTAWPHHRCVGDTTLAACPRTRAVQDRGANVQSSARQRATISGTSCHWPTWSASSAVSKYQLPGHTAHQTVYCWQPCLSGCCSSSLEQSARGRHLIVITAVFPASTKDSSFQLSYPRLILWLLVRHRYSGPCYNIVILATLKNYVYLLTSDE